MNSGGLKAGVCTKNISGGEQQTNKKVVVVSYLFFSVIVFMLVLVWKDNKKKTWRRYIYIEVKKKELRNNLMYINKPFIYQQPWKLLSAIRSMACYRHHDSNSYE